MNPIWAGKGWQARALWPLSIIFWCVVWLRKKLYKAGMLSVNAFSVPVIVVGNISVGGTGKTPIVSAVVKRLIASGRKPGIVSRGYGATAAKLPRAVDPSTPVELAGDEPLLLAIDTGVPICICIDRSAAVEWLINHTEVDVVVSDDGLQHYAMHRDCEIAVVDGLRMLGNGWLLPAGPLREPPSRLRQTDIIAIQQSNGASDACRQTCVQQLGLTSGNAANTGHFYLEISTLENVHNQQRIELATLFGQKVHAVAGLGNPQRFFTSLRAAGLELVEHVMPDHHRYVADDLIFDDELPILVTSKDAVKVRALSVDLSRTFEVSVVAQLDESLDHAIDKMIATLT